MMKHDLTEQRFGRLIAKSIVGKQNRYVLWLCHCDCGSIIHMTSRRLISGNTQSCGCFRRDATRQRYTTHGLRRAPEYQTWANMLIRCKRDDKNAKWYRERGIAVCDRWLTDFQAFYDDMGPRPSPQHSIERKNNALGYSPENCCWATAIDQNNNRRNNRFLTFNGKTQTVTQWAREIGVTYSTISNRLRSGWPIEKILSKSLEA